MSEPTKKLDTRWVVRVKEDSHGHQVVGTHNLYMHLTEEQIALMYEIFGTSDKVLSAICGRPKDGNARDS